MKVTMALFCKTFTNVCTYFDSIISDSDFDVNDEETFELLMSHFPSGTSLKNMNHFYQMKKFGGVYRFNYEKHINLKKYGRTIPPKFDFSLA
jgi:hypothetical protein